MLDFLFDNHIFARFKRFCITLFKFSLFTYHQHIDAYDNNGVCVFIGYSYIADDGEDRCKIIWVHKDHREKYSEYLEEDEEN